MHQLEMDKISSDEARLCFAEFNEDTAWQIGLRLVDFGRLRKLPIVINIRTPDATLFHAALAGSAPTNDDWARRKSNVTLRYHRSSLAVGLKFRAKGMAEPGATQGMPPEDFAAHGGSFPARLKNGRVVAAITVSGLPETEDHELVVNAIADFLAQTSGD